MLNKFNGFKFLFFLCFLMVVLTAWALFIWITERYLNEEVLRNVLL